MITPSPNFVSTDLGRLHVGRTGTGRRSCCGTACSSTPGRGGRWWTSWRATGTRCTRSTGRRTAGARRCRATSRSRRWWRRRAGAGSLGLTDPVDWVGNAWGGHVGIRLATGARLRTLTTIGTPVQGFTLRGEAHQGLAARRDVPVHRSERLHHQAAVRLPARRRNPLPPNRIRLRRSDGVVPRSRTVGECFTPCGR